MKRGELFPSGWVWRLREGIAVCMLAGVGWTQVTERISVRWNGSQSSGTSDLPGPANRIVTPDGRYVVFESAGNLVPSDTNGTWDVYVRDRLSGTDDQVSVAIGGGQTNGESGIYGVSISSDGRFVAFYSEASNLVAGDSNGAPDIFVRDRQLRTTELVSVSTGGTQCDNRCRHPWISPDGRYVAFASDASNLVPGDTNAVADVFVRDRLTGTTERVSVGTGGTQGDGDSDGPALSADARYVAFYSRATNLVAGDTNGHMDVFVRDRQNGTTERVSLGAGSVQGNGDSAPASISSDGRFVGFTSYASNLVPGDTNGTSDVFLFDRRMGTIERVSVTAGGGQGNNQSGDAAISADGRYVAFFSGSTNLIPGDSHGADVFLRDRFRGTTERMSVSTTGALAAGGSCALPGISEDGRFVVFRSEARNLVPGDSNASTDVFIHDRWSAGFTSLCYAGAGGVIACPCSNPPSGPWSGCDNSSTTGGASLSATGIAYFSMDSLAFTTTGENPTATTLLLQGTVLVSSGISYGQGVRCVGGTLLRLFTKTAVAGSITAPDLPAGDPTVSRRSANLGDVIQPGQSRWYLGYYRDPIVLGACPASSTFNATQTGQVTWWP